MNRFRNNEGEGGMQSNWRNWLGGLGALVLFVFSMSSGVAQAQSLTRVPINDQNLFLSGGNVAWINFARDIGPGTTDLDKFDEIFSQLHANGGNAMRLWLHTTGSVSPAFGGNTVTGPGVGTIEDLRAILDVAWRHEIGLMLCLWSFDMLRTSNGTTITDRSYALLTDSSLTRTYVNNALIPMVDSLKAHPAIIAWEIFNEPEGMSDEFGWDFNRHVAMNDIQRFINMTAAAIHRTDPEAAVTNGSWAFIASSDQTPTAAAGKATETPTDAEVVRARDALASRYDYEFTAGQTRSVLERLRSHANMNYYTDERLIAAGGDSLGVLDFYTVHYYEWAGTALSPFHHNASEWGLTKPLVIAEFFLGGGDDGNNNATFGVPYGDFYTTLFNRGYAGGLGWQWYNYPSGAEGVVNWPRILENTQTMYDLFPTAVDVDPGLRIYLFSAEPPGIEAGQSSELSWATSGADLVTLNGEVVDSAGTRTVMPLLTTEYRLDAIDTVAEDTVSSFLLVSVLDPNQVNRARQMPAFASTVEICCGNNAGAVLAVDGDSETRWSSEWEEGFADSDPDDEWLYVDLGAAFAVERVVLSWEVAYGSDYDIDVSYDAVTWTTVHEERGSDGGLDEITFANPPSARYVRMHGVARATTYGYSLWEFEVYGLASALQPPVASITLPATGAVLTKGGSPLVSVDASDPDGTIVEVEFFVDGESIGVDDSEPFSMTWANVTGGEHELRAVVTDDDGIAVSSPPVPAYVLPTSGFARYEAEAASFSGDVSIQSDVPASGGMFLDMRDSGSIVFDNVEAATTGEYWLVVRYNLQYDVPKYQYLIINGDTLEDVQFNGLTQSWQRRGLKVSLTAGTNTIEIAKFWGWMYFDYVEVSTDVVNVAAGDDDVQLSATLESIFPNPARSSATIDYVVDKASPTRMVLFDATGREVAVLVDAVRTAGRYSERVSLSGLASGVYFVRMQSGEFVGTREFIVMR